jgi:hypothetical protein
MQTSTCFLLKAQTRKTRRVVFNGNNPTNLLGTKRKKCLILAVVLMKSFSRTREEFYEEHAWKKDVIVNNSKDLTTVQVAKEQFSLTPKEPDKVACIYCGHFPPDHAEGKKQTIGNAN